MGTGNELYDILKTEVDTRIRTGHSTHKEDGRLQYGGTAMDSFELLASQVVYSKADDSGLGRWIWMRWETPEGKITRIVSAYAPV